MKLWTSFLGYRLKLLWLVSIFNHKECPFKQYSISQTVVIHSLCKNVLHHNKRPSIHQGSLIAILQFQLFYFAGAPRFSKSPPGEMTGFLGKETKIRCDFLGNPTPEVTWTRSPAKPLPQGHSEVKKDGLYINSTEGDDGGVYSCFARNDYGIKLHGTFLKVKSVGRYS